MTDIHRLTAERDLYRQLLDLAEIREGDAFLGEAAGLLMTCTGAAACLIGVFEGSELTWCTARGLPASDRDTVLAAVSTGVLQEVLTSGNTVHTSSAMLDERFSQRASVRRNQIAAVLCAPLRLDGRDGVVYLQRQEGGGPFAPEVRVLVGHICSRLATLGAQALVPVAADPTQTARARLARCDLVGRSPRMAKLLQEVAAAAPLGVDVLLTGPTGTGKSHLARLIHDNSPRARGRFVHVNCPAVPEALFEAEIFGARAGSFTGAVRDREGHVSEAEGGTLFLDEVGELPLTAQAKLLHLLQERRYTRLGDPRSRVTDIRVIAATNVPLDLAVENGTLREDLRYRLEVMPIRVPALEERREDVPHLASFFLERLKERHPDLGDLTFSPGALAALRMASWPGNVRQLAHRIESGMVRAYASGSLEIGSSHLFEQAPDTPPATWQESTRAFQRTLLERTLRDVDWNVAAAGVQLDLGRSQTYELVRAFGLKRP